MSRVLLEQLDKFDWECEDKDTRYLTHNYHPYSSKYIPQIANYLIQQLSKPNDLVVDPFVGSGTTLVECKLLGRNGIGVDLNPLARLISKVKSTPIPQDRLRRETDKLLQQTSDKVSALRGKPTLTSFADEQQGYVAKPPTYLTEIGRWYQPNVIAELAVIKAEIDGIQSERIRDFCLVAFSSILRTVSNAASGFGNLMISKSPPQKDHVLEKFQKRIELMLHEMMKFSSVASDSKIEVIEGDCRELTQIVGHGKIDLICTHPPYMAAVPYAEYQKLNLWWLGFSPRELDAKLIGGQRSREDTPQRFEKDMEKCFAEMYSILKPNKYCCIVVGNPLYRRKIWALNEIFIKQACEAGFTFIKQITRGKYRMTMGKMKNEYVLIFRKG